MSANQMSGLSAPRIADARMCDFELERLRPHSSTWRGLEQMEPRLLLSGDGLLGAYFNTVNLTDPAGTRVDATINYPADALGDDAGGMVTADDAYSIRWTGWVRADQAADWTFATYSNDGVRLWVDGQQIINNWTTHTRTRDQGLVNLATGWHPIVMEYFQDGGTTDAELRFARAGLAEMIIPQSELSSADPSIIGQPPTVDAGANQLVLLPTNSTVIDATAGDPDGQIVAYAWTQVSGPSAATFVNDDAEDVTVSDLVQGVYAFELLVTDNDGNTASDTVNVTVSPDTGGSATVSGELMRWHRVTLTWDGPNTNEAANPSPFLDYRLDVTLTGPSGQQMRVPGFFDGDGSGGGSGDKWRVRFSPNEVGQWSYSVDFRGGTNVAVADDPSTFASAGFFDGDTGVLDIIESDKTGRDFRAPQRGLISNQGEHYLTFAGSGQAWVKGGPDIPENMFGYDGFDNTPNAGHSFTAHAADWNPGDPDWDDDDADTVADDGRNLIGALNYLAERGANSIYFLPMNIGGDGQDTFPTIAEQDKTHYDISKLAQWETAFSHAQSKGIFLHFQLAETETANENYHDNGTLGPQRKLYYRELAARFGHHNGLQFNLGEENDYSTALREQFAAFIKSIDPYDHPVTSHTNTNQFSNVYSDLLGNGDFDMTSFQADLGGLDFGDPENTIEQWRRLSAQAGEKWVISLDEPQKIENDVTDTVNGYPHGRTSFMWPAYMSGAGGFEWYVQQDGGGHSFDQAIDDYNLMDEALSWTGHALAFLEMLPLLEMSPDKALGGSTAGGTTFVLQKPGQVYALYNAGGGEMSLDLTGQPGIYEVRWFDPRNGGALQTGTVATVAGGGVVSLGQAPGDVDQDWAVMVTATPPVVSAFSRGPGDKSDELHSLSAVFDSDVNVAADDLSIFNDTLGSAVDLTGIGFAYNTVTFEATWDLTSLATPLETGFYTASVSSDVTDDGGNALDGDGDGTGGDAFTQSLLVAAPGDTDLDGDVDNDDIFLILGANKFGAGPSNATWAQGDFDDDGDVDNDDIFLILGTSLFNTGSYAAEGSTSLTDGGSDVLESAEVSLFDGPSATTPTGTREGARQPFDAAVAHAFWRQRADALPARGLQRIGDDGLAVGSIYDEPLELTSVALV